MSTKILAQDCVSQLYSQKLRPASPHQCQLKEYWRCKLWYVYKTESKSPIKRNKRYTQYYRKFLKMQFWMKGARHKRSRYYMIQFKLKSRIGQIMHSEEIWSEMFSEDMEMTGREGPRKKFWDAGNVLLDLHSLKLINTFKTWAAHCI